MYGRLWPRNDDERGPPLTPTTTSARSSPSTTWSGDNVFFAATGVTDGELLRGVRFRAHEVLTQSL